MVSLWPISEDAREALESGEHVKLTIPTPGYGSVVVGFEEYVSEDYELCEWETDDGWKKPSDDSEEPDAWQFTVVPSTPEGVKEIEPYETVTFEHPSETYGKAKGYEFRDVEPLYTDE